MKDIIDPTHSGTFLPLNPQEMEAALDTHERLTGLRPRAEQEPSAEQLGALAAKLRASEPPYVDFSLWGPFDRRTAKDRKSLAMVWVDGALQPRTLKGPSSFTAWEQHWAVFSAAMLSLGACAVGPLDRYRAGISDLQLLYPHLWGLIARADEAMRSEQWRRMAARSHPQGDWSSVIAASAFAEEGARQWW